MMLKNDEWWLKNDEVKLVLEEDIVFAVLLFFSLILGWSSSPLTTPLPPGPSLLGLLFLLWRE